MNDLNVIVIENHRSRERIKDMGEVFTPEQYVQKMMTLFDAKVWSNEDTIFFEPSSGHGNIATAILERRISGLSSKYHRAKFDKPILRAIANAVNTFWAIDICAVNVEMTRKRCFDLISNVLQTTEFDLNDPQMREFVIHILCAIVSQIHNNEALSSLSDEKAAYSMASLTKLGRKWIEVNDHKPLNFDLSWCRIYKESKARNAHPLLYQRALKFVGAAMLESSARGFEEFSFAREAIHNLIQRRNYRGIA